MKGVVDAMFTQDGMTAIIILIVAIAAVAAAAAFVKED